MTPWHKTWHHCTWMKPETLVLFCYTFWGLQNTLIPKKQKGWEFRKNLEIGWKMQYWLSNFCWCNQNSSKFWYLQSGKDDEKGKQIKVSREAGSNNLKKNINPVTESFCHCCITSAFDCAEYIFLLSQTDTLPKDIFHLHNHHHHCHHNQHFHNDNPPTKYI